MPSFGPVKRKDLIRALKQAGFDGPHAGGKHEFMVKGDLRLTLPNSASGRNRQGSAFENLETSRDVTRGMGKIVTMCTPLSHWERGRGEGKRARLLGNQVCV